MPMFSDQERADIERALDEHLEAIYLRFETVKEDRLYIIRLARLFYTFTGRDWVSASGFMFTKGGQLI
jgi:hypothetical protein